MNSGCAYCSSCHRRFLSVSAHVCPRFQWTITFWIPDPWRKSKGAADLISWSWRVAKEVSTASFAAIQIFISAPVRTVLTAGDHQPSSGRVREVSLVFTDLIPTAIIDPSASNSCSQIWITDPDFDNFAQIWTCVLLERFLWLGSAGFRAELGAVAFSFLLFWISQLRFQVRTLVWRQELWFKNWLWLELV